MFIFLLSVVFHNVYRLFVYLGSRKYSTKAEKTLVELDKTKIELNLKDVIGDVSRSDEINFTLEVYENQQRTDAVFMALAVVVSLVVTGANYYRNGVSDSPNTKINHRQTKPEPREKKKENLTTTSGSIVIT